MISALVPCTPHVLSDGPRYQLLVVPFVLSVTHHQKTRMSAYGNAFKLTDSEAAPSHLEVTFNIKPQF